MSKLLLQKSRLLILFFTLFLGFVNHSKAATDTVSMRWVLISNNGSNLVVQLQIRGGASDHSTVFIDNSNFVFTYSGSDVSFSSGHTPWSGGIVPNDYTWQTPDLTDSDKTNQDYNYGVSNPPYTTAGDGNTPWQPAEFSTNITVVGNQFSINLTPNGIQNNQIDPLISSTGAYVISGVGVKWYPLVNLIFTIINPGGSVVIADANIQSGGIWSNIIANKTGAALSGSLARAGSVTPLTVNSLPVTLTNFSASIEKAVTQINWTTASEINNAYFTIERSIDGKNFVELFNKEGADNSQVRINYVAYDEHPLPGTSYYRLKQTDFNGASETFNMVSIFNPDVGNFAIESISPTDFSGDNPTLYYKMPAEASPRLVVQDMRGRIVEDQQIASAGGDNKYQLQNTGGWAPGMYIATMYYDGRSSYIKMVKN